ncbi:MAG: SDR family oxidoreductase [Bacteroidetes bacterium]|nr:SDR family oxidoreductase [Bacteroidota bacterium]MBU1373153.1 SDR family oxidoreductase [Bacteroidota bacterium]MBU1484335.1 SDR family oxidoreductase [Bacteroidota bacterium]MBU1761363.1 SDR family oxidoreductase [Bacteroidota bacterium]MBU2045863.1 SDR family oxidoreductase [Bacteroidota bacterium]
MKTYIISGAGSGIGKAMAIQLANEGNQIILLGRNKSRLEEVKSALSGENHLVAVADIADKSSVMAAAETIKNMAIDGIIANAGVGGENNWGEEDRWNEIVNTNLTGTYNFVNAFLPNLTLSKNKVKHILITSSVLARLGVVNYTAYCASKAGLLGLMRSWAMEFAPKNILVNAIAPGWVDTDMAQQGLQGIADGIGISKAEFFDMAMQSVPLKKMSQPQEIADLVSYLLKQKSITGQTIDINAGSVMNS